MARTRVMVGRFAAVAVALLALLALAPGAKASGETVMVAKDAKLGNILVDSEGRTLYRFTKDSVNTSSACYGQCAVNWPPLLVDGTPTAGEGVNGNLLGVLTRTDGTRQVMYNGMPLYYFKSDVNAGDTLGQNVGKVWFIVKPNTTTVGGQGVTLRAAQDAKLGPILVDGAGMTLYLYTKDSANTTVCYDGCATAWPPLLVGAGVTPALDGIGGTLGTVLRNDGNMQVTYNGIPLYYWFRDKKPGDTSGQGVNNVWYIIPPTAVGAPASAPAANAPAAPAAAPAAPAALPVTGGADLPVAPAAVALVLAGVGLAIRPRRRR